MYNHDIEMEFGTEKCAIVPMKGRKRKITERIELLNQERIRTLGQKENYKYLGILEVNTIKQVEIEEKNMKWIIQKNENTSRNQAVQQKSNQRSKLLEVFLVRYTVSFLK